MSITPLKIGNITISYPVLLAPMAGYTTPPFRLICQRLGSGMNYTEMVPAEGIRRRLPQTMSYLNSLPEETRLAAHIYGHSPEAFATASDIIQGMGNFTLIDINCGCPARKIAGKGSGVTLMQDPDKIFKIVRSTREFSSLPVTVKTRLGITPQDPKIAEVAQAVEEGGGSAITIHARFATQRHSGPVDYEILKRIKAERSIPIIGNGGIQSGSQAIDALIQNRIDGIMIGQAAIGNPWIFREVRQAMTGIPFSPVSAKERLEIIAEHLRGLHEIMQKKNLLRKRPSRYVERVTCQAFRGHLGKYLRGVKGVKNLQGNLMQMKSIDEVIDAVSRILQQDKQEL